MKKRVLAVLLASVMVASLAACGGSSSSSSSSEKKEEPAATEAAAEEEADEEAAAEEAPAESAATGDAWDAWADIDTSEHVVVTYMTTGDKPSNTATDDMLVALNKILTDKINAELKIYYIGWTDYLSVYNLTLAQMDGTVDLVGTASDWLDAWPNAKNGAFLELSEEDLQTYAPKTWASVTPERWEMCKYDGEIYLMPEDNYAQWTNHGWAYRLDWAREAGLANGVHSWEDLTTYFQYVKTAYPDLKALWDSDGTGLPVGGYLSSHSKFVSIDGLCSGALWGADNDNLYEIYCPYLTMTDDLVAYANMMKEWDTLGVWPTDVLNNTAVDNRQEFQDGLVAVEQHHTQTWTGLCSNDGTKAIYQQDPDCEVGFFYYGEEAQNLVRLSITHGCMAVSAASKNPERALMVYDMIRNDPDCYHLFTLGEEGRQYVVNAEGLWERPEGFDGTNDNLANNFWWGRNDDLEIRSATTNWDAVEALYDIYNGFAIDYPYGQFVPDVDFIQSKINQCQEVYTNYMKQICYGKFPGTAEEIVAEFQDALRAAGCDDVTAELQSQIDDLYK